MLEALQEIRGNQRVTTDNPEGAYEALEKYGVDLVALARQGKLDPVIGRDARDPQRDPHPVAQDQEQPGADRRAGRGQDGHRRGPGAPHRARRRAGGAEGPDDLRAGYDGADGRRQVPRRVRGAAQGRADGDQGRRRARDPLFIDEVHTIVGAGKTEGSSDAGNMLKPMLARGELHCIGATTLDEYRKHVEKDAALERRFQPVMVDAPIVEDTISILRGLKERFEVHHGVRIQDAALVAVGGAVGSLHQRPVPAGQGHRPDGRGLRVDPHGDRLHAGRAGRDHPQGHAPGDRGNGAEEGEGQGQQGAACRRCARSWPMLKAEADAMRAQWEAEKKAIEEVRELCASSWSRRGTRARKRSARTIWSAWPSCGTA